MKVEVVTDTKVFFELRESWNNLLSKSDSNSIFLTWEWLYSWWIHFKERNELFILLVKNDSGDVLLGIAPFYIQKKNEFPLGTVTKIKFLGSELVGSDFLDFIIPRGNDIEVLKFIYEFIHSKGKQYDVIVLEDIEIKSSSVTLISQYFKKGFQLLKISSQTCPYIELPNSNEKFLESLSSKMRSNIRRAMKKIETQKEVRFLLREGNNHLRRDIDLLFYLHNKRFNERDKCSKSSFCGEALISFHHDIAERLLQNNSLRLYFLELNNEPIAALYGFQYKTSFFYYQSGIDPDWSSFSLGIILYNLCIADCINKKIKEFNFLRGDEEYKFRWTKKSKFTLNFYIYNDTKVGTFLRYLSIIKMAAKNIISWS